MREISIREHDYTCAADLHEALARELNFPAYYGANLSAPNDCLTSIALPTRIVIVRDDSVRAAWFDKMCGVIGRAALENSSLTVLCVNA